LLAVGLVLALGAGWLARRFAGLSSRRQLLMVVAAAVAGAALLGALLAGGLLPKALAARIMGFSLGERSVWERLWWSKDALGLVKDSPILGSGGGGWAARYWQYQTYNYYTREIHNDYIQTLVETGLVTGPHPGPNRPPAGQPGPGPNHPQPGLGPGRRSRRTGGRGPAGAPGSGGGRDPADPGRSSRSRCRSGG